MALGFLASLSAAGCVFGGNAECSGGTTRCSSTKGVMQVCAGGEGYYYWSDRNCPGLDPVCSNDGQCEDRSNPSACPAGIESLAGQLQSAATPLRLADLDGDGALDLLLEQRGGLALSRGDGHGSFATPTPIPITIAGVLVDATLADADGDGNPDLILSTDDPSEVYVLHGDGTGVFQPARRYFVDRPLGLTDSADLDGDGRDEVVAVSNSDGESHIHLLSGLGDEQLTDNALTISELGTPPLFDSVTAARFDRTGNLDLFAQDFDGMFVLDATGASYRRAATVDNGVLVADMNGDGLADVVATNSSDYEAPRLYSYLAAGDGTIANRAETPAAQGAKLLAALDVDGDQRMDVVASYGGTTLAVFRGNGDGTFADPVSFSTNTTVLFHADLDGDGNDDLVVPSKDGGIAVLRAACTLP